MVDGVVGSVIDTGAEHLLLDAAVGEEVGLQAFNVLSEEVVSLMNQGNGNIADGFIAPNLDCLSIEVGIIMPQADTAGFPGFFRINIPQLQFANPKVVLIVKQKFLETCFSHIQQLNFSFGGGCSTFTTFGYILPPASCRLNHLVDGSVVDFQIGMGKIVGNIVDAFGFLKNYQIAIIAILLKKGLSHSNGF